MTSYMTLHTARNGKKTTEENRVALLATTAICLLRQARRRRKSPCWVRSWQLHGDESGFRKTLVQELERDDKAEHNNSYGQRQRPVFVGEGKKVTHVATQYNAG